jgi:hypothetical protein
MESDNTFDLLDLLALTEEEQLNNELTVEVLSSFADGLSRVATAAHLCADELADWALTLKPSPSSSRH